MSDLQPYQYSSLDAQAIRLLHIRRRAGALIVQLQHWALDHLPPYCALSYAWGSEDASETIQCIGGYLKTTPTLHSALHQYQKHESLRYVWVDAICIHQDDDQEKAKQVQMMNEIYTSAQKVYAWLGPSADGSELAMSSISSLNRIFGTIDEIERVDRYTLKEFGLPILEDSVWPALMRLYYRNWFMRLWVMQEVLLAKDIYIICGESMVPWEEFASFSNYYRLTRIMDDVLEYHKIPHRTVELPDNGIAATAIYDIMRNSLERFGRIRPLALLAMSRRKLAKEPVDKVYGLLAMIPLEVRSRIIVDYSLNNQRNYWNTYAQMFKILLEIEGTEALQLTPSRERCPELPSWCPDFNYESSSNAFGNVYNAGVMARRGDELTCSPLKPCLAERDLLMSGMLMDRVEQALPLAWKAVASVQYSCESACEVAKCEAACARLSSQIYGTQQDVPTQHMLTLVSGLTVRREQYPQDQLVEDYKNAVKRFNHLSTKPAEQQESPDQLELISAQRYQSAINIAWEHSKFFSTKNGSIGIGPDTIQSGDAICILFTAYTPFILRQTPAGDSYNFHGAAYVQGLMDGEAFAASNPLENFQEFLVR
ncbi:hypothetical protein MMC19_004603 [Ptychographa xylographoides]|nr:hypothetical protein [Ptychographa xylographoides]